MYNCLGFRILKKAFKNKSFVKYVDEIAILHIKKMHIAKICRTYVRKNYCWCRLIQHILVPARLLK